LSKSLIYRLKAVILSPNMLISVVIGVLLLTWNFFFNFIIYNLAIGPLKLTEMGSMFLNDIYQSHAMSGFDFFAPILAVLPATIIFCEDYNSGYIKSILGRIGRRQYLRESIICSSIAGGLAVSIPSFIAYTFYVLNGSPNLVKETATYSSVFDESIFVNIQFIWDGGLVVAILLILAFLFGAIWSNVGLCISAFIPNRYIALAAPFALYFSSHLFCYRINSLLFLSPVNMLMPIVDVIPDLLYPFVYQMFLFVAVLLLFFEKAKWRLKDV